MGHTVSAVSTIVMDRMKYCCEMNDTPGSPTEWFDLGVSLRQQACFGDAMNAFMMAAETAVEEMKRIRDVFPRNPAVENDIAALESLRSRALASVELLKEINGFVNVDLMNP